MMVPLSRMKLAVAEAYKAVENDVDNITDRECDDALEALEDLLKSEVAMQYLCIELTELARP